MAPEPAIRILIVDDHFLVRIGLVTALRLHGDLEVVGEASTAMQALELYRQHRPDIVLMDLRMPDLNGIEATRTLLAEAPDARVIILSSYDAAEELHRALQSGARGFLLKDALNDELVQAIRTVAHGGLHVAAEMGRCLTELEGRSAPAPRADLPGRVVSPGTK